MADEPSASQGQGAAAEDTVVQGGTPGTPPGGSAAGVNQGATGNRPLGESPLSAQQADKDAFAERPEAFVGAAFAGGLTLALILRRLAR
jgi:hypothetical protein